MRTLPGAIGGALSAEDIAFFTAGSSHVPGTPSSNLTLREQEMSAALRIAVSLHSRGDLEGAASGYKVPTVAPARAVVRRRPHVQRFEQSVLNTATDLSTRAQDVRLFERAPLQRVMNRYRGELPHTPRPRAVMARAESARPSLTPCARRVASRAAGRALMGLALIYSKRGNNDEALRAITSALELFKAHVDMCVHARPPRVLVAACGHHCLTRALYPRCAAPTPPTARTSSWHWPRRATGPRAPMCLPLWTGWAPTPLPAPMRW